MARVCEMQVSRHEGLGSERFGGRQHERFQRSFQFGRIWPV